MYLYFFNLPAGNTKQQRWCEQIQSRLIGYDIEGTIIQSSIFADSKTSVIQAASNEDITTVIIVGDDKTFIQAVQWVAPFNKTIGYVPLERSYFSSFLGMPSAKDTENICRTLARRRKKEVSAVHINNAFSFYSISAKLNAGDSLSIDNTLHIKPSAPVRLRIQPQSKKRFAFSLLPDQVENKKISSVLRKKQGPQQTRLDCFYISLSSEREPSPTLLIDGYVETTLPAIITPHNQTLRFIIGPKHK